MVEDGLKYTDAVDFTGCPSSSNIYGRALWAAWDYASPKAMTIETMMINKLVRYLMGRQPINQYGLFTRALLPAKREDRFWNEDFQY